MFDLLKKKIGSFISGLTKKEEAPKEEVTSPKEEPVVVLEAKHPVKESKPTHHEIAPQVQETTVANVEVTPKSEKPPVQKEGIPQTPSARVRAKEMQEEPKVEKSEEKPKKSVEAIQKKEIQPKEKAIVEKKEVIPPRVEKLPKEKPSPKQFQEQPPEPKQVISTPARTPKPPRKEEPTISKDRISAAPLKEIEIAQEKGEKKVKQDLGGAIASFITGVVEIKEHDVGELLDTLELELLESDVSLEVADTIIQELKKRLIGKKVKRGAVEKEIKQEITNTLVSIMQADTTEIIKRFEKKPVTIMVCGINGAGKTTTMAKLAHRFLAQGKKVCFAAADTFRAAAIEQLGVHATRLNVPIIKRPYGADPTAVAFDAVNYAKAHEIDVILIDTAGRQDTNTNLMNELKKMDRVIKPDLKIYIGESLAGNAILDQVRTFKEEIGLDGVILTKIDCDPKGGTIISIRSATGVPILFVGTGQSYEDLREFNAQEIVERILE